MEARCKHGLKKDECSWCLGNPPSKEWETASYSIHEKDVLTFIERNISMNREKKHEHRKISIPREGDEQLIDEM